MLERRKAPRGRLSGRFSDSMWNPGNPRKETLKALKRLNTTGHLGQDWDTLLSLAKEMDGPKRTWPQFGRERIHRIGKQTRRPLRTRHHHRSSQVRIVWRKARVEPAAGKHCSHVQSRAPTRCAVRSGAELLHAIFLWIFSLVMCRWPEREGGAAQSSGG